MFALMRFFIGDPLQSIVKDLVRFKELAKEYKQRKTELWCNPMLQALYNLQNRSEDPLLLTGEVMNEATWEVAVSAADGESKNTMVGFVIGIKVLPGRVHEPSRHWLHSR